MKHCPPDTDIWDCPPAPHGEAVGTASADLSCDLITAQIWGRSREAPPPGTAVGLPGAWRWPALPPVGRWGKATEPGGRQTCTGRCPRRWGSRPGGSIHVFHRQQSGGFPRSCPPGAEARLRRLAARTDGARGQRKQQGVYGARGWQVHSVRGQLRTVRAPGGGRYTASVRGQLQTARAPGLEGTQRQRAALDSAGPGGGRYTVSEGSSGQCGPRGWQVHSVRGQLGRCGLCVCGPGPRFCGAAFRCPLDTALVPQELCWGTGPFPLWLHHSEAVG